MALKAFSVLHSSTNAPDNNSISKEDLSSIRTRHDKMARQRKHVEVQKPTEELNNASTSRRGRRKHSTPVETPQNLDDASTQAETEPATTTNPTTDDAPTKRRGRRKKGEEVGGNGEEDPKAGNKRKQNDDDDDDGQEKKKRRGGRKKKKEESETPEPNFLELAKRGEKDSLREELTGARAERDQLAARLAEVEAQLKEHQ